LNRRFLLPPRDRLRTLSADATVSRWLRRADRLAATGAGARAQLLRQFAVSPQGWPLAALTRQLDAGDAGEALWLRTDPAHVRADMSAVRLLACGAMGLDRTQADALLESLTPLFEESGWELSAPSAERWYLRLPRDAPLPAFCDPEQALGAEIHDLLPAGPAGRRWRALLNEAQIVLHHHPVNAVRVRDGRPAVNSLWFFGGGCLPERVTTSATAVASDDPGLRAFALAAGAAMVAAPTTFAATAASADLIDLRHHRDAAVLTRDWLLPLCDALATGRVERAELDFADGVRFVLASAQRWRIWRRGTLWTQ